MKHPQTFDLTGYIANHLPGFGFGGDVLDQWTLGLRFNIGLGHVDCALAIYNQAFGSADTIVLISEDFPWDSDPNRWYSLFSVPGLLRRSSAVTLNSWQPAQPAKDELRTLTWAAGLGQRAAFSGNCQSGPRTNSGGKGTHLHPGSAGRTVVSHMYDDRGLDIIATSTVPLLPLHKRFGDWINGAKLS